MHIMQHLRLKHRNRFARVRAYNDKPECIHEDEIPPEIVGFRSIVPLSMGKIFIQAGGVIDEISVKLASRY